MPLMGTYCDQSRLLSGWLLEEFKGAKVTGKYWPEILSVGSGHEWVRKHRWSGAAVRGSVWSVGRQHSESEGFDGGVIHSEAGAKTGLAGTAEHLAEEAVVGDIGRIGKADARGEFIAREARACAALPDRWGTGFQQARPERLRTACPVRWLKSDCTFHTRARCGPSASRS